jgi:hypothetical protein
MKEYQFHEYSDLFPLLPAADIRILADDIKARGLQQPIVLFEAKILDGRHRYEACRIAKVAPRFSVYSGKDPVGFVLTSNLHRRHLDQAQRAMVAAKLATVRQGERNDVEAKQPSANLPKVDQPSAAELLNVSTRSVGTATKILDASPSLTKAVETGKLSLNAAAQKVDEKKGRNEPVFDETGWIVPESLYELWDRRGEVREMLAQLTNIASRLLGFQQAKDPLFKGVNYSAAVNRLQLAYMEIKAAQLYAVCTTCQGRNFSKCTLCKGKGLISQFVWNTIVPEEVKEIRKKGSKA